MQAIDGLEESGLMDKNEMKNKHLEEIKENNKSYQNRIIDLTQKVSKIQAELINSDFNIHSHNLEYGKVLDENGEPLLLCRGTQRDLDDNGNFIIPEKEHYGEKFKVGVFLGKENEAQHHSEAANKEGEQSKIYKTFVRGKNFKVLERKPDYWSQPEDMKYLQSNYDGIWVKQKTEEGMRGGNSVNILEYVAFDNNDVLIVGID